MCYTKQQLTRGGISMTRQSYGDVQLDNSEMFALGAAAGAVVTAVINEYLERRRPKTAWERAQARSADALDALSYSAKQSRKRARSYVDDATDYVQDALGVRPSAWKKTKKSVKKARKQASKQALGIKEATVAALGTVAAANVVDTVRDYASSATERVVGDPYAVSGSIRETIKDSVGNLRLGGNDSGFTERAREVSGSAVETLKSAASTTADSVKDYASTVRETLKDVEIGDKARNYSTLVAGTVKEYSATARETIKDAKIGDKAKDYSGLIADTVKDYASTASDTLKDAKIAEKAKDYSGLITDTVKEYTSTAADTLKDVKLGEKAKDYATLAGATVATYSAGASSVAKQSASKLSESATHLAEATGGQVQGLRKGVRKSVKRTQRRTRWGLRAFVIGLVLGLLAAPQSGQNTRDALTSFVEDLLDVFMPDNQQSGSARL